jgi:4-carboxymuconolactone decarboxylase
VIKRKQRIAMRDLSTMAAEDRTTVEKNAMNGQVFNIFKVLAHHPSLVKRWTPFAGHVLSKQTLPFRDRELLILRIGWLNQAEYEFAQHELIAKRGGVSDADIERLKQGPKAAGWSEHEAALLQVADDLYENSVVSDATWAVLSKKYSTEQLRRAARRFPAGRPKVGSLPALVRGSAPSDHPPNRSPREPEGESHERRDPTAEAHVAGEHAAAPDRTCALRWLRGQD